mmetsp:Transcript_37275/g.86947  ORF Transcript_37275/g.86947 Transcript_37275/m.86947 type:complete len:413 (-) Transcript_37275:45-1283(-)
MLTTTGSQHDLSTPQRFLPSLSFDDELMSNRQNASKNHDLALGTREYLIDPAKENGSKNFPSATTPTSAAAPTERIDYDPSTLPDPQLVLARGYILSRISIRTLITRSWQQSYFIQYGPNIIFIFRSLADYEDWLINPYHSPREREILVKLVINFSPTQFEGQQKDKNMRSDPRCGKIQGVLGHRVTQLTYKNYRNYFIGDVGSNFRNIFRRNNQSTTESSAIVESLVGSPSSTSQAASSKSKRQMPVTTLGSERGVRGTNKNLCMMYQFKLVRIMGHGPSPIIVAAFASPLQKEMTTFRDCVCSCIRFANNLSSNKSATRSLYRTQSNVTSRRRQMTDHESHVSQRGAEAQLPNYVEFSRMSSSQRKDMVAFDRDAGVAGIYDDKTELSSSHLNASSRSLRLDRVQSDLLT